MAGIALLAAVILAVELGGASWPAEGAPSSTATDAAVADSIAAASEVAYTLGATARMDTPGVEATPDMPAGELLVAKTWTNVRRSRSRGADLEAVLTPGDTVYADSLHRDWYRVALDGEVMGYAHRVTLAR
jgi:hypothetical protein